MTVPMKAEIYAPLTMYCQNPNCGLPIPLPDPTHQPRSANLPNWSKDNWKQAFLCSQCGHAYAYSADGAHSWIEGIDDPRPKVNYLYHISYECAVVGCKFPTRLLVVSGDEGTTTVYQRAVSCARLHFHCERMGVPHYSRLPPYPPPVEMPCLFSFLTLLMESPG
jgi:hypothetical protein